MNSTSCRSHSSVAYHIRTQAKNISNTHPPAQYIFFNRRIFGPVLPITSYSTAAASDKNVAAAPPPSRRCHYPPVQQQQQHSCSFFAHTSTHLRQYVSAGCFPCVKSKNKAYSLLLSYAFGRYIPVLREYLKVVPFVPFVPFRLLFPFRPNTSVPLLHSSSTIMRYLGAREGARTVSWCPWLFSLAQQQCRPTYF